MSAEATSPKSILSTRNLKATATRVSFLALLQNAGTAVPFSRIQEVFSETDRITLYRTLQTLLDKGIIHQAFRDQEGVYYALCGSGCPAEVHRHNHAHFKCTNCQQVTCESLSNEIALTLPGFRIDHVQINLQGVCKQCN